MKTMQRTHGFKVARSIAATIAVVLITGKVLAGTPVQSKVSAGDVIYGDSNGLVIGPGPANPRDRLRPQSGFVYVTGRARREPTIHAAELSFNADGTMQGRQAWMQIESPGTFEVRAEHGKALSFVYPLEGEIPHTLVGGRLADWKAGLIAGWYLVAVRCIGGNCGWIRVTVSGHEITPWALPESRDAATRVPLPFDLPPSMVAPGLIPPSDIALPRVEARQ